jgi:hypothetical protein
MKLNGEASVNPRRTALCGPAAILLADLVDD